MYSHVPREYIRVSLGLWHRAPWQRPCPANPAIGPHGEAEAICVVHEPEDGLKLVVAIGPAPDHVQEEIELGGCWVVRAGQIIDASHLRSPRATARRSS